MYFPSRSVSAVRLSCANTVLYGMCALPRCLVRRRLRSSTSWFHASCMFLEKEPSGGVAVGSCPWPVRWAVRARIRISACHLPRSPPRPVATVPRVRVPVRSPNLSSLHIPYYPTRLPTYPISLTHDTMHQPSPLYHISTKLCERARDLLSQPYTLTPVPHR